MTFENFVWKTNKHPGCFGLDVIETFSSQHMRAIRYFNDIWTNCCWKKLWTFSGEWKYSILKRGSLSHWGRVTHICGSKLTIVGSGAKPLFPGILFIGPVGTRFSEILIEIYTFSFKKMHVKMSFGKWLPFCLGLNIYIFFRWINLTHKQLENHNCVLVTVATEGMVQKHQAISIHNMANIHSVEMQGKMKNAILY